jgi:hypothetical protein
LEKKKKKTECENSNQDCEKSTNHFANNDFTINRSGPEKTSTCLFSWQKINNKNKNSADIAVK